MNKLEQCASISEMIYRAKEENSEEEMEEQPDFEELQVNYNDFDVSPLIDLALDTKDEEWFMNLTVKK